MMILAFVGGVVIAALIGSGLFWAMTNISIRKGKRK